MYPSVKSEGTKLIGKGVFMNKVKSWFKKDKAQNNSEVQDVKGYVKEVPGVKPERKKAEKGKKFNIVSKKTEKAAGVKVKSVEAVKASKANKAETSLKQPETGSVIGTTNKDSKPRKLFGNLFGKKTSLFS